VDRLLTKPLGAVRLRAMARAFAAFICLSSDVEGELASHGVPRARLRRIPNGVDTDCFHPAAGEDERRSLRRSHGLPDGAPLALYCGRFDPVKRLELLIEAIRDSKHDLVLVGEGSREPQLRALADRRGVADRVTFLSKVDDPAPLYRAADVYVSASSTEGMSNSVLEAMATGLPVVSARASGMEELVGSDGGVLLDGRPDSFAASLAALADDPSRRAALGAAARQRARGEYSLDATADALLRLYREVLSR
jgi:glycosyltransferase involved in cell wall biosynthesis